MPRIGVVAIRAPQQTPRDEQHETQTGPVVTRRRLIRVAVAEGTFAVVLEKSSSGASGEIRRAGHAGCLPLAVAALTLHAFISDLAMERAADDIPLLLGG